MHMGDSVDLHDTRDDQTNGTKLNNKLQRNQISFITNEVELMTLSTHALPQWSLDGNLDKNMIKDSCM